MKAAIVEKFGELPHYGEFDVPQPGDGQQRVWVKAAALSQLVRAQAAGRHYSSAQPPLVPGADGVGVLDNGQRGELSVAVKDEVIYGKYGGMDIEFNGDEVKILRESDILAKVV